MKILVVGTGYVGLVHAAVCAEVGHEVYGYDIDPHKIASLASGDASKIESYVNEPSLAPIIQGTLGKRLFFSSSLDFNLDEIQCVFFCLPTPSDMDGNSDLSAYQNAVAVIGKALAKRISSHRVVFVNKSTVPIGSICLLQRLLTESGVKNFGVASNPEFLAEGSAVAGARRPDRIAVGCDEAEDFDLLHKFYSPFLKDPSTQYVETTPETAEAIKYVANTLLLTYISFWNGVGARLAEKIPTIDIDQLIRGVTSDYRISTWGSHVSNGAGGSCFGKDIRSLIYQLRHLDVSTKMLESSREVNEYQKTYLVERAISEASFDFNNKKIALLGLAFKKGTHDMREASSIEVAKALLAKGVSEIRAYDPLALETAKKEFSPEKNILFKNITYHSDMESALEGSDALFISSDCSEFKDLSNIIKKIIKGPYLILDGRRMLSDLQALSEHGCDYLPVGGTFLKGD